jgi:hypothetical protein
VYSAAVSLALALAAMLAMPSGAGAAPEEPTPDGSANAPAKDASGGTEGARDGAEGARGGAEGARGGAEGATGANTTPPAAGSANANANDAAPAADGGDAAGAAPLPPTPPPTPPPPPDDGTRALRRPELSLGRIFRGPFSTSRLFSMPTADVIGAYVLTLSGDASLLQETGALTSAGVLSIGFGDIAQLEYRHTSAISVTGVNAPLPAVGVQLKVPLAERRNVPAFGVAFRLGVPRTEQLGDTVIEEAVTDLYLVGRLRFDFAPWLTLHGGARISSARIELSGDRTGTENTLTERRLTLPTGGYEIAMNKTAKIVGELALAPRFAFMPGEDTRPDIGYGVLGRLGLRWSVTPAVIIDGSINYQTDFGRIADAATLDAIVQWDIRLGAEVFVPWGALACRAVGVFCD